MNRWRRQDAEVLLELERDNRISNYSHMPDHTGEWSSFFGIIFGLVGIAFFWLVIAAVGLWAWHQIFG